MGSFGRGIWSFPRCTQGICSALDHSWVSVLKWNQKFHSQLLSQLNINVYFHLFHSCLGYFSFHTQRSKVPDWPLEGSVFSQFLREAGWTCRELHGDYEWTSISFNEAQGNYLTTFFIFFSWDRNFHLVQYLISSPRNVSYRIPS